MCRLNSSQQHPTGPQGPAARPVLVQQQQAAVGRQLGQSLKLGQRPSPAVARQQPRLSQWPGGQQQPSDNPTAPAAAGPQPQGRHQRTQLRALPSPGLQKHTKAGHRTTHHRPCQHTLPGSAQGRQCQGQRTEPGRDFQHKLRGSSHCRRQCCHRGRVLCCCCRGCRPDHRQPPWHRSR
jgi:hypothetical protein